MLLSTTQSKNRNFELPIADFFPFILVKTKSNRILKLNLPISLLIASVLFFSLNSQAGIVVTNVSRASNFVLGDGTNTVIYAGVMGLVANGDCGTTTSDSALCNGCVYSPGTPVACNPVRIHSSLKLAISFKITADVTNASFNVGYATSSSSTPTKFSSGVTPTTATYSKDSTGVVYIDWSQICLQAYSDSTCDDPAAAVNNFKIYLGLQDGSEAFPSGKNVAISVEFPNENEDDVDTPDCTGASTASLFCQFVAKPGDEKVRIDDLVGTCNSTYKGLRIYYSTEGFDQATYGGTSADIGLDSNCATTSDGIITGLPNYVPHYFRVSIVDIANNNFYLANPVTDLGLTACTDPISPTTDLNCDYIATPGLVEGLLPEDFNCFVATAVHGSPFAPVVRDLRKFRNLFLKPYSLGRAFIRLYYAEGSKLAKFIEKKEFIKTIVRGVLMPVWGFAWLSLHYGLLGSSLLLLSFIFLLIFNLREPRWSKKGD